MTMTDEQKTKIETQARFKRIAGFICLGLALLNAAFAVYAMVDEKNWHSGRGGLAMAVLLFVLGMRALDRDKRRPPPGA